MLETLERFRTGLENGEFSIADVSRATGIPFPTLANIRQETWQQKTLERLAAIERFLDTRECRKGQKPEQFATTESSVLTPSE